MAGVPTASLQAMRRGALAEPVAECQTEFMTIRATTKNQTLMKSSSQRRINLPATLTAGLLILLTGCVHPDRSPQHETTITHGTERDEPGETASSAVSPPKDVELQSNILTDALARLSEHGLDSEDYGLSHILDLSDHPGAQDLVAQQAWLLAATHLAHGVLDPGTLQRRLAAGAAESAMFTHLDPQGGPAALADALDRMAPQHPEYLALRAELAREQAALALATDPTVRDGHTARIGQLHVNMERWRWLPHTLGPRYVIANIPGFDVAAIEQGAVHTSHAAIFGKTNRETPTFSDSIEYIIFNPWWDVPDSIARADKLPQFRRDPGIIGRLGYRVLDRQGKAINPADINWSEVSAASFPYRLRQAPGPSNALGQVKIMFPNPHNVYLHDTPDRDLFDADQRTFSSGCVRVKEPLDLAAWLLEDTVGWDRAQIDAAVASGAETRVDLLAPVPVYVVYMTAVDDSCGGVRYLTDIYGRDDAILEALERPILR